MSPESHPERGSTIALDTKYEVSTQVDSSAPADKFPEMCGSATLAIDVSSTSMNVASVTTTAITQGLIDPSGILSFASSLLCMARSALLADRLPVVTYNWLLVFLYSANFAFPAC